MHVLKQLKECNHLWLCMDKPAVVVMQRTVGFQEAKAGVLALPDPKNQLQLSSLLAHKLGCLQHDLTTQKR